jgi:phage terminase large subunit-like protein
VSRYNAIRTGGKKQATVRLANKIDRYFCDCTPECKTVNRATFRRLDGPLGVLDWYPVGTPIPSPVKEDHKNLDGSQRYCRALYPKHVYLMQAGARYRERCIMAGNRIGKSELGGYEVTRHLTGIYPDWWTGRRFDEPTSVWVSGDTGNTTKNIIQEKLLGPPTAIGTGFIPAHLLVHKIKKSGVADAYSTAWVRHISGGYSTVEFKSYDQRREAFQGTAQHVIWLDEEPPMDVYTECLLRTAKTSDFPGGIILLTYTPLKGRTPLVKDWMKDADQPDLYAEAA